MNPQGTHDATTPADIDEFRIVRMLGRGGMGAVYLAHDTILDRAVALKLVRAGTSEESRLRFLTEARAIARLDHPNIIGIFRAGTTGTGEPYLVQELVRGQPIDRMGLPFSERRCLELTTAIARGLAAAHRHGVLHRDVKPSNIMIDEAGTPRLLDFGLAKLTGAVPLERPPGAPPVSPRASSPGAIDAVDVTAELPAEELAEPDAEGLATTETADGSLASPGWPASLASPPSPPSPTSIDGRGRARPADRRIDHTSPGALLGTPRYMAPELWRAETATARSDLYSLGVVMYELLTGAPPYPQTDRASLERAVLEGPAATPIDACVPGIDPAFAALVTRCLARDPTERPESADEVVYQLERIAAGAPPMPEGNPYRGLAPFEAEQRALFFGRGPEISSIVDRLRTASLVVVAGDSGIGKSSLCRAGVVPAITGGALGDRRTWSARTLTPGRDCIAALGDALGGLPAVGAQAAIAEGNQLPAALARHLSIPPDRGVVIFVDQLEELVTQNAPGLATRAAEILAALGAGVPGVKVILAVRGDFFTRVAALPGLRAVATRSLHLVRGLSPDDARDAVESPARAKGVQLETRAMVDALVASIVDRPAALPLLQFALSELWKRRDVERAVIPERALADIGGVSGALASYADQMLTALAAPERTAARRVLLALVTADGTRASRVRSELVVAGDDATAAALEALVTGRLVVARDVADGPPEYELAHESLLTAWGTLRGWLDDAAGQRGIRTRLSAAADEWQRLGRSRELLWRRAQLAEAASLQDLTAGDRAFLRASRRNARLRIALAVAIAAAVPAAAAMTWWGAARDQREQREQQVIERLREANDHMWSGRVKAAQARTMQDEAVALFRAAAVPHRMSTLSRVLQAGIPAAMSKVQKSVQNDRVEQREQRWNNAMQRFGEARVDMAEATSRLEAALSIGALQDLVRGRMAAALYEQAVLADALRDSVNELEKRLVAYAGEDGLFVVLWRKRIKVAISAEAATHIEIAQYQTRDGLRSLGRPIVTVESDRLDAELAPGSYRATLSAPEIEPVLFPFVVRRGSDAMTLRVTLPRERVPDGFVYVPAGTFLQGSDDHQTVALTDHRRNFLRSPPMHEETTGAYLIGKYEVTFAQWLRYLRSLPDDEREMRRQKDVITGKAVLSLDPVGRDGRIYRLTLLTIDDIFHAKEGERLEYPNRDLNQSIVWENSPAAGVTFEDAAEYTKWLSREVPGARPCTALEWERAARGADGRIFPHGDRLRPDEANVVETYDHNYPGPDEVGTHPQSASPFGIMDMSGNVSEWVQDVWDVSVRGGSWFFSPPTAVTTNITAGQPTRHEAFVGLRVCADPPAVTEAGAPRSSR